MDSGDLYRVTLPYLVAGVVVLNGRIVTAAPILGWSVGKPLADLERWVKAKRGTVEAVP